MILAQNLRLKKKEKQKAIENDEKLEKERTKMEEEKLAFKSNKIEMAKVDSLMQKEGLVKVFDYEGNGYRNLKIGS